MPASTRNLAGADSASIGTATHVGNRMSTEPKDIDHETEPLLQALKANLPALVALLEEADSHLSLIHI